MLHKVRMFSANGQSLSLISVPNAPFTRPMGTNVTQPHPTQEHHNDQSNKDHLDMCVWLKDITIVNDDNDDTY